MKKWTLCLVALAALSAGALLAQDLTGSWQGTLQAGKDLRIVMKLDKGEGAGLKATMYSIDQPAPPLNASVTVQGTSVKISVPQLGGTYEGKVSTDGKVIIGTWSQGQSLPLNLTKATDATAWALPEPPAPIKPMAADANPAFDVATIKPSVPDAPGKGINVNGRNFSTRNTTLGDLISFSYGLHASQITGGPAWMDSDKYDIAAVPDTPGSPSEKQLKSMVQKLLAERFKLVFHSGKKELSFYALVAGKTEPKITKSDADPNSLPTLGFRGLGNLFVRNSTLDAFAGLMQSAVLEKPVINQTGLTGKYDFTLNWTPDQTQFTGLGVKVPPPSDKPDAPPDLYTAIQQQLGMKLDSTKGPVDVMAIDKVEKPSDN